MKYVRVYKKYPIFLIALLLACTMVFASCSDDTSSNSSSIPPASNTQASSITPIGAQATCLTINPPSLVKLADGHFKLIDEIKNCGGKVAGPLKITTQIDTATTKHSTNLLGPITIPANGQSMYQTFPGRTGSTNKEIDFLSPAASSAVITVLVTINGAIQGEWDGQVTIPAR